MTATTSSSTASYSGRGGHGRRHHRADAGPHTLGVAASTRPGAVPSPTSSWSCPPAPPTTRSPGARRWRGSAALAREQPGVIGRGRRATPAATRPTPGTPRSGTPGPHRRPGRSPSSTTSAVTDRDTTLDRLQRRASGPHRGRGQRRARAAPLAWSVTFTATAGTTYVIAVNGYRTFAAGVGAVQPEPGPAPRPPAAVTTTTLAVVVTGRSATLTARSPRPPALRRATSSSATTACWSARRRPVCTPPRRSRSPTCSRATTRSGRRSSRRQRALHQLQSSVVTPPIAATPSTTTLTRHRRADTSTSPPPSPSRRVRRPAPSSSGRAHPRGQRDRLRRQRFAALTGVKPGEHSYTATFVPADTRGTTAPPPRRSSARSTPRRPRPRPRPLNAMPTGRR